jgi:hypothetical protein
MRFMVLMYPGEQAESGVLPDEGALSEMMKFNEELANAGVMLSGDGLQPSSKGARISFSGGKPRVTDGPFAESKELLGGFWMIDVKSKDEAVELFKRCPAQDAERLEIRQVFEMADFNIDPESELGARVERVSAQVKEKNT